MPPAVIPRHALSLVRDAFGAFRVVVLNGARQVGKSTMLGLLHAELGGSSYTLDDRDVLRTARTDPGGLLSEARRPLLIDEVQRGGDPLVLAIKADVDRHGFENGRFVLAGSSRFLTVPTLSESLTGRVRIVELWPLSQAERVGTVRSPIDELFDVAATRSLGAVPMRRAEVFDRVVAGGFPAAVRITSSRDRDDWFADYLTTLLQRDLAQLRSPRRSLDLQRLLRLLGQRTAQELVVANFAHDLGISADTVKDYLGLFESIYLHLTVPAWTSGATGRVVHRPKLHVVDSGIACHLHGLGTDELRRPGHARAGALLESFVAGEIIRGIGVSRSRPSVHHYRDKQRREIDLVLERRDGTVVGIEVKAANDVDEDDFRHLRWFRDVLGERFAHGIVLHLGERSLPFGDRLTSVPVSTLWADVGT